MAGGIPIQVECYSDYRGEQTPLRLVLRGRPIEVTELLDRWLGPGHRYFKPRGNDGGIYLIRHDTAEQAWELTLFDSNRPDRPRLSQP